MGSQWEINRQAIDSRKPRDTERNSREIWRSFSSNEEFSQEHDSEFFVFVSVRV